MISNRAEFISRFLYKIPKGESYNSPGSLPSPELIEKAAAATKDIIGFDAHRASFATLAEVIDVCTAEELASEEYGLAATNATKHPRVVALKELDPAGRACIAAASAQGLLWMENCRGCGAKSYSLRSEIAKRVMTAILVSVGSVKKGYTADQLASLAQIGASLRGMDLFAIRARDTIKKIVGKKR